MTSHRRIAVGTTATIVIAALASSDPSTQPAPLAMNTARVSIAGTSNVHSYRIWTDTVRLTAVRLSSTVATETFWDDVVRPGGLERFEIEVPVATLTSRDAGLDKNMYKALKLETNRHITFRLTALESGTAGTLMAVGDLRIAGVEHEVVLPLEIQRRDDTLVVRGRVSVLMTDYGISPPTAMLGMLKTHAKVVVTFEVVIAMPGT